MKAPKEFWTEKGNDSVDGSDMPDDVSGFHFYFTFDAFFIVFRTFFVSN